MISNNLDEVAQIHQPQNNSSCILQISQVDSILYLGVGAIETCQIWS